MQPFHVDHPESIIGLHLTDIGFHATRANHADLSEAEQQYLAALQMAGFQEGAYAMMLGTKPQTFAYGLNDSPVGWAALVMGGVKLRRRRETLVLLMNGFAQRRPVL